MGKGGEASEDAICKGPGERRWWRERGQGSRVKGQMTKAASLSRIWLPDVLSIYAPGLPPLTHGLQGTKSGKSLFGWGKVEGFSREVNQYCVGSGSWYW